MFEGSSKRFLPFDEKAYLMQFKDDIHGAGRQDVILGIGALRKEFTYYFYRFLEQSGIKTHLYQPGLVNGGIVVQKCVPVKLEILVRNVARGHWVDAHKVPLFEPGVVFDTPIVELCVKMKNEQFDDPRINTALAIALHKHAKDPSLRGHMLANADEMVRLNALALQINSHYTRALQAHDWILEDFKFEVGFIGDRREFVLIDEISPDSSRIRDQDGGSLTKDLFRERRPAKEIYERYQALTEAMKCI